MANTFRLFRFAETVCILDSDPRCLLHCRSMGVNEIGYNEHETQLSVCYELVKRVSCAIWISSYFFSIAAHCQNAAIWMRNDLWSFPQRLELIHFKTHAIGNLVINNHRIYLHFPIKSLLHLTRCCQIVRRVSTKIAFVVVAQSENMFCFNSFVLRLLQSKISIHHFHNNQITWSQHFTDIHRRCSLFPRNILTLSPAKQPILFDMLLLSLSIRTDENLFIYVQTEKNMLLSECMFLFNWFCGWNDWLIGNCDGFDSSAKTFYENIPFNSQLKYVKVSAPARVRSDA